MKRRVLFILVLLLIALPCVYAQMGTGQPSPILNFFQHYWFPSYNPDEDPWTSDIYKGLFLRESYNYTGTQDFPGFDNSEANHLRTTIRYHDQTAQRITLHTSTGEILYIDASVYDDLLGLRKHIDLSMTSSSGVTRSINNSQWALFGNDMALYIDLAQKLGNNSYPELFTVIAAVPVDTEVMAVIEARSAGKSTYADAVVYWVPTGVYITNLEIDNQGGEYNLIIGAYTTEELSDAIDATMRDMSGSEKTLWDLVQDGISIAITFTYMAIGVIAFLKFIFIDNFIAVVCLYLSLTAVMSVVTSKDIFTAGKKFISYQVKLFHFLQAVIEFTVGLIVKLATIISSLLPW